MEIVNDFMNGIENMKETSSSEKGYAQRITILEKIHNKLGFTQARIENFEFDYLARLMSSITFSPTPLPRVSEVKKKLALDPPINEDENDQK